MLETLKSSSVKTARTKVDGLILKSIFLKKGLGSTL